MDCCPDEDEWSDEPSDEDKPEEIEEVSKPVSCMSAHEQLSELHRLMNECGVETLFPPLDGTAFYLGICKINHSCTPNVFVRYACAQRSTAESTSNERELWQEEDRRSLGLQAEVVSIRDIARGEELLQSYIDQSLGKKAIL